MLRADLHGLPSTYLQVGTHDLLLSDSDLLAERARGSGRRRRLHALRGHVARLPARCRAAARGGRGDGRPRRGARATSGPGVRWRDERGAADRRSTGRAERRASRHHPERRDHRRRLRRHRTGDHAEAGRHRLVRRSSRRRTGSAVSGGTTPTRALTCDVPSHLYSFSFEPNPRLEPRATRRSRRSSPTSSAASTKYGLEPQPAARRPRWRSADFDDERRAVAGRPRLAGEAIEADVLVSACGQLSRPALTRIAGADRFEGPIFHTARWDHDVDLDGKRVAVIGTGREHDPGRPGDRRPGRPARRLPALGAVRDPEEGPALPRLGEASLPLVPAGAAGCRASGSGSSSSSSSPPSTSSSRSGGSAVRMSERNLDEQVCDPELPRALTPRSRDRLQARPDLERLLRDLRAAERRARHPGRPRADRDRGGRRGRNRAAGRRRRALHRLREHQLPGADGDARARRPGAERGLARRARTPTSG